MRVQPETERIQVTKERLDDVLKTAQRSLPQNMRQDFTAFVVRSLGDAMHLKEIEEHAHALIALWSQAADSGMRPDEKEFEKAMVRVASTLLKLKQQRLIHDQKPNA